MVRAAVSFIIGIALALLLSAAAQFMILPLVGPGGLGIARVVGFVVFWAVAGTVAATIVRGAVWRQA